jgi:hypothetical protein
VHKRVAVLVAAVLTIAVVGVVAWRFLGQKSVYEQAVAMMPQSTLRLSYTDWAGVRAAAGGTSLGPESSRREVSAFLNRSYDQDLTAVSAVSDSTYALMQKYGFSPLDADWEMYGQSREGSVDVVRLDDSVDMEGIERNLRTLGYKAPAAGSDSGGTWVGSADLVAQIDGSLSAVQQNVVVLADKRLVLMSDSPSYVSTAADVVRGDAPSVTEVAGVSDLASKVADPVDAVMWASDFACDDLSMGDADDEDQRVATDLVQKAGGINPLSGLVMAQDKDHRFVVGMHFETSDEASANLQPRVNLASGNAPGQGGTFGERFTITKAEAHGKNIVMNLTPRHRESLLGDISEGPVLFATC